LPVVWLNPLAARHPVGVADSITRDSKASMSGAFAAHADRPRDPTRIDELFMEVQGKEPSAHRNAGD
jgi:hypothetical protein